MFKNTCSQCRSGKVFHHFLFMNTNCPNCNHRFEREEGYFLGAMILAYFFSTVLALPILLYAVFKSEVDLGLAMTAACAMILVTGPVIYRYAKLAWMYIESRIKI